MNIMKNEVDMYEAVRAILAKQLRIKDASTITMESAIQKDLGADSVDILQLLMKIEDGYGITIPDERLAQFVTVADVVNFLNSINR